MRLGITAFITGLVITSFGVIMLIPGLFDLFHGSESSEAFFLTSGICVFFGLLSSLSSYDYWQSLSIKETFFTTSVVWLTTVFFCSLPFYFWNSDIGFATSFFESMSGITSTGATALTGLDNLPRGILLWRAILQWIGGIGIVMIAIAVLPMLSVGGMQIFQSESSDKFGEKAFPKLAKVTEVIILIYITFTALCAVILFFAGMDVFDAVTHAMTCLSTGGFSNYDDSINHFDSAVIEWILVIFMILGALPFMTYYYMVVGKSKKVKRNAEIKSYLFIILFLGFLLTFWLWTHDIYPSLSTALRSGFFSIVSVITTTGYTSSDYCAWGSFAFVLFFFLIFMGGCSGSSTGGIKNFRIGILFLSVVKKLKQMIYPHGVFILRYNDKSVSEEVVESIIVFVTTFIGAMIICSLCLSFMGLDFITSLSGTVASLANVGPGLGDTIGPSGNYSTLPDAAKWILSFCMMLGRLEFTTVIVLLIPLKSLLNSNKLSV